LLNIILRDAAVALYSLILYAITVAIYATSVVVLSKFIGVLYALITVTAATIAFIVIFKETLFESVTDEGQKEHD